MKTLISYFTLLALVATSTATTCLIQTSEKVLENNNWITLKNECLTAVNDQIKEEIGASLKYLSMAGHFAQDSKNRPGFAKKFFEAASEEREHAIKLIEYLSMRGENSDDIPDFRSLPEEWVATTVSTGESALLEALKMETHVTNKIVEVIETCEKDNKFGKANGSFKLKNDYHLVDYLTGDFLDEQYKGQKEIANHLSTLNKMNENHPEMGEFLFDKKLLLGEPPM